MLHLTEIRISKPFSNVRSSSDGDGDENKVHEPLFIF